MKLIANHPYSLAPPQQSASSPASLWPPRQRSSLHTSACRTVATAAPLQETALALLRQKSHCRHSHPTPSSKMIHPLMTESGIGLILAPPHGAAPQLGSYHRQFSKKRMILNYRFPSSSSSFASLHDSTLATQSFYAVIWAFIKRFGVVLFHYIYLLCAICILYK